MRIKQIYENAFINQGYSRIVMLPMGFIGEKQKYKSFVKNIKSKVSPIWSKNVENRRS